MVTASRALARMAAVSHTRSLLVAACISARRNSLVTDSSTWRAGE
jgi:hypothetical protein